MMVRRGGSAILAAMATAALSACGAPAQQAAPPQSAEKKTVQAPHVQTPLNAQSMVDTPCTALTPEQVVTLRVPDSEQKDTSSDSGASCRWANRDSGAYVAVAWQNQNTAGLDVLYKQKTAQAYFSPTIVEGYPGVFASDSDDRKSGSCVFHAGVSDKLAFFSIIQGQPPAAQACDLAKQAAADVIKNLKQQQGAS